MRAEFTAANVTPLPAPKDLGIRAGRLKIDPPDKPQHTEAGHEAAAGLMFVGRIFN
jgi:hypothetical protein